MFFGKSNNNGNGVNVNTSFYTSYSDTSLLTVGGWNKSLSIKLSPAVGKNADGITQYAQENGQQINTGITQENALALLEGYKKEILPAINNASSAKVSISMGANENKKILSIIYDGTDAYLEIATGVNSDGIANEANVITHKFNKKSYMTGYNYINGTGSEVPVEADLYNFIEKIKACQDIIPTTAHAINYNNAIKSVYSSRGNTNTSNVDNSYSAPINNYNGDMSDFLPMS